MPLPDGNPHWLHRPFTSLRPWGIAALILLALDGVLRLIWPADPRVLRQPMRAAACMADDALENLVESRSEPRRDAASPVPWDIVLLGDSVLGAVNNPAGQRLADYLHSALARQGVVARVHNLSAGGAHAGDQYAALLRLHTRLQGGPAKLDHLLVVLSVNPIFFSRRHSQPPLSFPCLYDDLADLLIAEPSLLESDLRHRLGLSPPAPAWHRSLATALAQGSYLLQQRRRLGERIFGQHTTWTDWLRAGLPQRRSGSVADGATAEAPWSARGLSADRYRSSYDFLPFHDPAALHAELTTRLVRYLATHREIAVLVEQVPQNHHMMDPLTASPGYVQLVQRLGDQFRAAGLEYRSHDRAPQLRSEHFTDLDHLTAAGNAALAELVAADVLQRLAPATGRVP